MRKDRVRFQCAFCGQISEGSADCVGAEGDCPSCGKSFRLEALGEVPIKKPNCLKCYLDMFKRYVGFRGRSCRREFWWAFLLNTIVSFVLAIVDEAVFGIYFLVALLPLMAIQVRRLHDTSKSGWWVFLLPMPILNIAYLVWLATDGDKGKNRFGNDPLARFWHCNQIGK